MTPFDASPSGFIETPAEVRDPFTLESLIAWLETKPGDIQYFYAAPDTCLLAQYTEASGGTFDRNTSFYHIGDAKLSADPYKIPDELDRIIRPTPNTFGAALSRAVAGRSR